MNEVKIMKLQHHPAVLPLYAAFLVDDQLWMVLPYVAGGSAQDIVKRSNDGAVRGMIGVHGSGAAIPRYRCSRAVWRWRAVCFHRGFGPGRWAGFSLGL